MSNQEQCPSCGGYKVNEEDGSGCASNISTHLILTVFYFWGMDYRMDTYCPSGKCYERFSS